MMYLLSLFSGKLSSCDVTLPPIQTFPLTVLCGVCAVGLFLDHFLWALDPAFIFISVTELAPTNALTIANRTFTSFQYLITTEGYNFVPQLQYSFYLDVAG